MARFLAYLAGVGLAWLITALLPPVASAQAGGHGQFDGVVDVSTLPPAPAGLQAPGRQVPHGVPDPVLLRDAKAQLNAAGSLGAPAPGPGEPGLPPTLVSSFFGLRFSETAGFIPPDTQVAAGPSHIALAVNDRYRVFNKAGAPLLTISLTQLFQTGSLTIFDPKIRFDLQSHRWFVAAVTTDVAQAHLRLAVSATSDPTGVFFRYSFVFGGAPSIPDFPGFATTDDKIAITANAFACSGNCNTFGSFVGTEFVLLRKADFVAGLTGACGGTLGCQFFDANQGNFTIQPAQALSSSTDLFMAALPFTVAPSSIRVWGVTGVPPAAVVTPTDIGLVSTGLSIPPDAVQLGSARLVATNDNRLLDAAFRNGTVWVTGTTGCVPSGDAATRACLRFIQIQTPAPAILQNFTFSTAGYYYYFPAVQTDSSNNLLAVFSRSAAVEFAGVWAGGRLASDPPNTFQSPTLIKAGEAPYDPLLIGFSETRWGDYSGAAVDPSDPSAVWVAGEYARAEGGAEWGTFIGQIRLAAPPPLPFTNGVYVATGRIDGTAGAEIITGPDTGGGPHVKIFKSDGTQVGPGFFAYAAGFTGGVRVAACDFDADGRDEIVTGAGPGGGAHVRVFKMSTGGAIMTELASFLAYPAGFTGGVFVACGNVEGTLGTMNVVTGAGAGGSSHTRVLRYSPGAPGGVVPVFELLAYGLFSGGVHVAAGDVDGSGRASVITGPGPGGGAHVRVLKAVGGSLGSLGEFFAYPAGFTGGAWVAAGNVIGGAAAEVITGAGPGGSPHVRIFDGTGTEVAFPGFLAYAAGFAGGARVAAGDVNAAGLQEIVTGPGPGGGPHILSFTASGVPLGGGFFAY